jgi:hypothetical protein
MSVTTDGVVDAISAELDLAGLNLAAAKSAQVSKDTRTGRARLAVCRERIGALLDI